MDERADIELPLASGGVLQLEGRLGAGARGGAVVAPPHPLYGGRLDNPVVEALAHGLQGAGVASLRFNFRGTGDSAGEPSASATDADADFAAALALLAARRAGPLVAAGYSFGAACALRVAARDPRITRLILVAPPLALLDVDALRAFGGPVAVLLGDDDSFAPLARMKPALAVSAHARIEVFDGTDHFFSSGGLDDLAARVTTFATQQF